MARTIALSTALSKSETNEPDAFPKTALQSLKLSSNFTDSANTIIMREIHVLTGGSVSTKI